MARRLLFRHAASVRWQSKARFRIGQGVMKEGVYGEFATLAKVDNHYLVLQGFEAGEHDALTRM